MTNTRHFVNSDGVYIGGFGDGAQPHDGAIEVPEPPHGLAIWNGSEWAVAHAIKDLPKIPADFAADHRWPEEM